MSPSSPILLSTAYLPPVQYITKFLLGEPVLIEVHENYQKQSYRNRCYIYGANGKQCLVIPVKKHHGEKTPVNQVEIDYQKSWRKIHLKSIESAYRLSAFYEYYADDFAGLYDHEIPLLIEWNQKILEKVMQMLGIRQALLTTGKWEDKASGYLDYRQSIHPKDRLNKQDPSFTPQPYQQVFRERYGFIPNLSIVDLLFNEGPEGVSILRRSLRCNPSSEQSQQDKGDNSHQY